MVTPNNEKYDADSIRQQTDLLELASRYVQLKKEGAEYVGLCCFHSDTTPPGNFKVNPAKQVWACFACGAHEEHGADVIGFLMKAESIEFPEACRRLLNGSGTTRPQIPVAQRELQRPPPRITCPPPDDAPPAPLTHRRFGEPSGTWIYRTETGALWGYVCRWDTEQDGKRGKEYRCVTWGAQGDLPPSWERKHFADANGLRPIYGPDRLADNPHKQVLICEGEKAADAAQQLFPGMVAIAWPGGANAVNRVDWSPLKGRKVVLWPDNDEPGITAMGRLAAMLQNIAIEIKGLRVTDMPPGWDAADWTPDIGETPQDALAWAKPRVFTYKNDVSHGETPTSQPHEPPNPAEIPLEAYSGDAGNFGYPDTNERPAAQNDPVSAKLVGIYDQQYTGPKPTAASLGVIYYKGTERQAKAQDWLWRDKIACGVITGLSGDPGLGKSQITASLAAIVTTGGCWPVTRDRAPKGSVIILNCEDAFETTIAPRLIAAGADMDKIYVFDGVETVGNNGVPQARMFDLSRDVQKLVVMMQEIGDVRLVIIDPISAYVGKDTDSHNNTDVRSVLAPLTKAAEADPANGKEGAAILIVNHLNKDSSKSALHRTQGSVAWTAAPRCIWAVIKDKEDESGRSRLMMCVKNNIGPDTNGFRYEIEGFHLTDSEPLIETSRIMWHTEAVEIGAESAFQSNIDTEEKTATLEATEFLLDLLKFGPIPVHEIELAARKNGQQLFHLRRAKAKLKIKSSKQIGGKWVWALPD